MLGINCDEQKLPAQLCLPIGSYLWCTSLIAQVYESMSNPITYCLMTEAWIESLVTIIMFYTSMTTTICTYIGFPEICNYAPKYHQLFKLDKALPY